MTTMPVVWCTDPNSVNNKLAAFTLHGIKLQGNVTEKQVLALRQLVNAAAEGRFILPADGTFVLMDSGISMDSAIVAEETSNNKENTDTTNATKSDDTYIVMPMTQCPNATATPTLEPKYSTFALASNADEQVLYEFLCCAKCMHQNGGSKCAAKARLANSNSISRKLLQRYFQHCKRNNATSDVNEPLAPEDPVYCIASKYTRHYHRRHCNMSTLKARNRHNRHKLPMQSVKIFHNRFSFNATAEIPVTIKADQKLYARVNKKSAYSAKMSHSDNSCESQLAPPARQRKIGTFCGGLQDSLLNEQTAALHDCDRSRLEQSQAATTTATATIVKDLISFDDDVDFVASNTNQEAEQNQMVDLLSAPNNELEDSAKNTPPNSPRSNTSSRKTSFDSTCTISSMDSGFMEMQNKLENSLQSGSNSSTTTATNNANRKSTHPHISQIFVATTEPDDVGEKLAHLNYKECLTQSRNRRKSYEEFKAMFNVLAATQNESVLQEMNSNERQSATTVPRKISLEFGKSEKQTETATTTTTAKQLQSISEQGSKALSEATKSVLLDLNNSSHNMNSGNNVSHNAKPDCENEFAAIEAGKVVGIQAAIAEMDTADAATSTNNTTINASSEIMRKNSDFLSQILDQQLMAKEKEKAQLRRKSYDEFKRLVRECELSMGVNENVTVSELKRQNSRHRKSYASFLLMRRNLAKDGNKINDTTTTTTENREELQGTCMSQQQNRSMANYKRNFKIYDKLVYGTIYDIIQRKNDIYNLTYQKYDKYMTYGTIYEILHRKSTQTTINSASLGVGNSEQRKSLTAILEKSTTGNEVNDVERLKKSGIIYDIIQRQPATNLATVSGSALVRKYGTIYDILQGEKLVGGSKAAISDNEKSHNRFTVSKIDESQVQAEIKPATAEHAESSNKPVVFAYCETQKSATASVDHKAAKPHKMRRLSNILSYKSTNTSTKCDKSFDSIEDAEETPAVKRYVGVSPMLLPLDSEELYARIVAQNRAACAATKQIVKSNSFDAISSTVAATTPSPPRPRRSLKQHNCLSVARQARPLIKKFSLDNSTDIAPALQERGIKPQPQQRRWSNQMPLKCNCATDADLCENDCKKSKLTHNCGNMLPASTSTSNDCCTCACFVCKGANAKKCAETTTAAKKGKSRRLSEFTRGEFLNEKL